MSLKMNPSDAHVVSPEEREEESGDRKISPLKREHSADGEGSGPMKDDPIVEKNKNSKGGEQAEYLQVKGLIRTTAMVMIKRHAGGKRVAPFDIFNGEKTRKVGCNWRGEKAVIEILETTRGRKLDLKINKLKQILQALDDEKLYLVSKKSVPKVDYLSQEKCL